LKKLSNVERRLTIVVPVTKVEEAYNRANQSIGEKCQYQGF